MSTSGRTTRRIAAVLAAATLATTGSLGGAFVGTASAATVATDSPSTLTHRLPDPSYAEFTYVNNTTRLLRCTGFVSDLEWMRGLRDAVVGATNPGAAASAYTADHPRPAGTAMFTIPLTASGATGTNTVAYDGPRPSGAVVECYDATYSELEFSLPDTPFGSLDLGSLGTGSLGS